MIGLPEDKVIITVAQTGALVTKSMNPNLPEQPEEIAESAHACYEEGAVICHIHARDKEGKTTGSREVFQQIHDRIRAKCTIIIQDSTGGGPNLTFEQRIECVYAKPEMASLNMGSLMRVSGQYAGTPFSNMREDIETYVTRMRELGVKPEMEVYSHAMFREVENLISKGLVDKPYYINLVLGMKYQGALEATPKYLESLIDFLPEHVIFNVTAVGAAQLPLTTMGMILGGCARVGMEDNIYYGKGELANSNAQLVARSVRIARELGKEPATPEEARRILGLPG
ncbi:MAG TPA: 3-keto-5-aminohexanoate cleavage protein [Desulfatiglandales bacterium]|nr:3-keto-5-aminohexanoate cleavage protein [Desulfatiglandales bacterium]